jgi:hypothetical protein
MPDTDQDQAEEVIPIQNLIRNRWFLTLAIVIAIAAAVTLIVVYSGGGGGGGGY